MEDFFHSLIDRFQQELSRFAGREGLAKAVGPLLILCAVTLLSFFAVDIFYKVVALQMSSGETASAGRNAAGASFPSQKPSAENYQVIIDRNLFATTLKALPDNSAAGYQTGEEYTAFDLKGTIAVDAATGYAIVEDKGKGRQKLYRIGEMIGQARLTRVTRNTAVLVSGGRELVMKIKETAENSPLGKSQQGARGSISMSRQELTRGLGDLKSLMSQAVVRPFLVEGVQQGFVVSNIMPGSLYQKLGLKNGDVVTDVNNKKLESADDVLQMVEMMQSGGNVSVNLLRNGQNETLNYSFH